MTNGQTPSYESFLTSGPSSRAREFLLALKAGEPARYSHANSTANVARNVLRNSAQAAGLRVRFRIVENEVWAVLLKPEDVKA